MEAARGMGHPYIPNSIDDTKKKMLDAIGIQDLDDLFSDIPENLRLRQRPKLPQPHSEVEVKRNVEEILSKNVTDGEYLSFLGAGVWAHNVPAAVDSLAGRTEFLTSYTPYQPEVSQGMLQALYEYQSLICELLDMEVVDSSMYDWATALGEAARMANRVTGRTEFLYPHHIHPERLATLRAYSEPVGIKLVEVQNNPENGQINLEDVEDKVCDQTAGLYVENPSYLGPLITNLQELAKVMHDSGGLLVAGVDPTSLGLVKPPGQYGADIAVGEGQPLGSYPNYGGPLLGIFGARDDPRLLRQVPGRIIGMTTARGGETGYCMVLQTREQHIRREKATSNICSNEALLAIRAAVYLALLGPEGMRSLGEYVTTMSNYLARLLSETSGIEAPYFAAPHFKEFTVRLTKKGKTVPALNQNLLAQGIFGGLPLERDFPELEEACLLCVTERHTREDLEKMSNAVRCFMKEE
jgi:glycine dehydrogenase subunit 1